MTALIDRLQTASAYTAAVQGYVPADIADAPFSGVAVNIGLRIVDSVSEGLSAIVDAADIVSSEGGIGNGVALVQAVLAILKRISTAFEKGADETHRNWLLARTTLLGGGFRDRPFGLIGCDKLPGIGCDSAGCWRFKRYFIADDLAADRCVPYADPLGVIDNQYTDYIGGDNVAGKRYANSPSLPGGGVLRPYGIKLADWGWTWPDNCTDWTVLLLDAYAQDCSAGWEYKLPNDYPRCTVNWPWCYPLSSPARVQGWWGKTAGAEEAAVAALYALPTPQHMRVPWAEYLESRRYLRAALSYHYPDARETSPGIWKRNMAQVGGITPVNDTPSMGEPGYPAYAPPPWTRAPRPSFDDYAQALARLQAFAQCRAAILTNPGRVPASIVSYANAVDWPDGY